MVSVYGLGNPLMDIILRADHSTITQLDAVPGTMNLVDFDHQQRVISLGKDPVFSAGGSCANTIRGLAWLTGKERDLGSPAYTGAVGQDENGGRFQRAMEAEGVRTLLARKPVPTGTSAILVTPDFERTMFTYLGACREYAVSDFDEDLLSQAHIFHTTGYMWDTVNQEEAAKRGIVEAQKRGVQVSFDIADPFVARRYRDRLVHWLPGKIDILFANLEELRAMTDVAGEPGEVLDAAGGYAPVVVMKYGKLGCLILSAGGAVRVPGEAVDPRDTTGAGDSFAAGFLYTYLQGRPLAECGRLANRLASRVVTVQGCDYDLLDRSEILSR
ncbi:MAG TPA: adenosine kinase [Spirochaetia bacterium]|nr:adenosine kinase [Spirochaetia bacterium]